MSAAPKVKEAIKFSVEVTNGPHAGMRLNFAKGSVTIGRGPENDIVLANDPRTSRQHAEIKQRDGEFLVVNLSSKNFIMVNGQGTESQVLKQGDVIQIGESELRFSAEGPMTATGSQAAAAAAPNPLVKPSPAFTPKAQTPSQDRKSTRLNSSHTDISRMPSSA